MIVRNSLFFTFEDYRSPVGKGHIVECSTKNVYNHVSTWTDSGQRVNFTGLFFSQALTGLVVRIPYRIYDIFSGGSIHRGVANANHEYRILNVEKSGKVCKLAYALLLVKNVLISLAKDIVKLVTYPLAMIALQFASLFGIASPLDAWVIYSKIEDVWSPDNSLQKYKIAPDCMNLMFLYSAPCMQTQQSYKKHNLYPLLGNYHENDLRTLRFKLCRELERFAVYFGQAYTRLHQLVEDLNPRIADIIKKNKTPPEQQKNGLYERQRYNNMYFSLTALNNLFDEIIQAKDAWFKDTNASDQTPGLVATMVNKLEST